MSGQPPSNVSIRDGPNSLTPASCYYHLADLCLAEGAIHASTAHLESLAEFACHVLLTVLSVMSFQDSCYMFMRGSQCC